MKGGCTAETSKMHGVTETIPSDKDKVRNLVRVFKFHWRVYITKCWTKTIDTRVDAVAMEVVVRATELRRPAELSHQFEAAAADAFEASTARLLPPPKRRPLPPLL